jgi:uncharacterized protein (TIGR03083 family)
MTARADLAPPIPVDVLDLLAPERAELVDLLGGLAPADWDRRTECPAWTVRGIALHVLGDDLSLLARQRDAEVPSLLTEPSLPGWEGEPSNVLDRFNERWVHASTFLSPALIVDLLERTGVWTHDWYTTVEPDAPGEIVMLFGPGPAPYRSIAAREYVERWVHHLQIRRALELDAGPLGAPPFDRRAYDVVVRALAALVALVVSDVDDTVVYELGAEAWTFVHDDAHDAAHGWAPRHGRIDDPTATLTVAPAICPTLVSRGLNRPDAAAAFTVTGDADLGAALVDATAAVMSAYYLEL